MLFVNTPCVEFCTPVFPARLFHGEGLLSSLVQQGMISDQNIQ
jgi:hypothetical protein